MTAKELIDILQKVPENTPIKLDIDRPPMDIGFTKTICDDSGKTLYVAIG